MATCSHLAPNGEKSILYQSLEQKYGPEKANDYWTAVRTQQFLNKFGDWMSKNLFGEAKNKTIPLDINGEPTIEAVESRLRLVKGSMELRPGIIANPEQEVMVNQIMDFLNGELPQGTNPYPDLYLVEGGAGVGKTTSVNKALEGFRGQIIGATVSDEARTILQQNMIGKKTLTIAKLLGLVADKTGSKLIFRRRNAAEEKKFRDQGKIDPIEEADLVIIDEASMVDKETWKMLNDLLPPGTKMIFLGDRTQLPPIGEQISNVFEKLDKGPNYSKLTQVMRFQMDAPIFAVTEGLFATNVRAQQETGTLPVYNPLAKRQLEDVVVNGEAVLYRSKSHKWLEELAQEFQTNKGLKDLVVIADKNDTVAGINKAIREIIYGVGAEDYQVGERIRMAEPFVQGNMVIAENNLKGIVQAKKEGVISGLPVIYLTVAFEKVNIRGEISMVPTAIPIIKPGHELQYKEILERLRQAAVANKYLWRDFYQFKETFGQVDYTYAMTTHKVQGSTYKAVHVLESEIYRPKTPREGLEINQMMRTATSRATTKLVIITDKVDNTDSTLVDEFIAKSRKPVEEVKPPAQPVQSKGEIGKTYTIKDGKKTSIATIVRESGAREEGDQGEDLGKTWIATIKGESGEVLITDSDIIEEFKEPDPREEGQQGADEPGTPTPADYTNHSGGAVGSDSEWDRIGREFGVTNHRHYWHGKKTPTGNTQITDEQLEEGWQKVLQANKTLNRKPGAYKSLLSRNWFQVKNADAIFAIGTMDNDRLVNGGTGWAVQMAIDAGKPVYVYEQRLTEWRKYNYSTKRFEKTNTPVLTKNFAGIGTREIDNLGKEAIRDVYKATFNPSRKQVQPGIEEVTPEIPINLETKLPKSRLGESEMLARIKALYDAALAAPDKIHRVTYEHVSDRMKVGKTQYTSRELANLFDSIPKPPNVVFMPSFQALIDNSPRRIALQYASELPAPFISRDAERVAATAAQLLIPKQDASGNSVGFFSPAEQKEIQDSVVAITERLYRQDPALKANAIVKAIGMFKAKEQQLLKRGDNDKAAIFTSIYNHRVQVATEALKQLSAMGLHTDDDTVDRILDAVEQLAPMTEQEKVDFIAANPEIDPEDADIYTGEFLESVGRIARDWSDNTFELDPRDTASARIKMFIGTLYEQDLGVYTVAEDGEQLTDEALSNPGSMPLSRQLETARRLSRKPFWFKDAKSSAALQEWLKENYPRFSRENFLGIGKSADYDTIFQEVLNTLGDQLQGTTFEHAMTLLETHSNPTIQQMADELRKADQSMKNEFMVVMSKQYQPFVMALFNTARDARGREYYVLNPIHSNRYNQRTTLIRHWQEQQKLSDLSIVDAAGNRVLDVKRIRDNWLPMLDHAVKKIADWSEPKNRKWFVRNMGNILRASGIGVTDEMMEDLFENPNKWSGNSSPGAMFAINQNGQPAGLFSIFIMKSAGQLSTSDEVTIEGATELSQMNNPLYTENSMMQGLARLVSKYTPVLYSSNHRNSEGKNVYDWGLNTKLSHQFRQLVQKFADYDSMLKSADFSRNNWLMEVLVNNPAQIEGLELAYFDGLKPKWGNRGTTRQKMSDREQLLTSILLFQNRGNGFNKLSKVHYMSLTHSDKTMTPVFRNMPRVDTGRYRFMPNTIVGKTDSALFKVFKAEYDRIKNHAGKTFDHKQYEQGKGLFYLIPDFNYDSMKAMVREGFLTETEFNLIWPAGQRQLTSVINSDRELVVINKILTRFVNNLVMNTLTKWGQNGIVTADTNIFDTIYVQKLKNVNEIREVVREGRLIDEPETKFIDATGKEISPQQVNAMVAGTAAKDYAINYFLFNTAMSQIFFGDPAETFKRSKTGNTDMDHVAATMAEYAKRLAKDIAPRTDLYWPDHKKQYNTLTLSDVKTKEVYMKDIAELRKAYFEDSTEATDAQEITTVQEKLDVLMAAGKISSHHYEQMSRIISDAAGGYYEFTDPDHLKIILQPDKPIYAGTRSQRDGTLFTDYIKSSSYPLYPPLTKGMEIDKLRELMESTNIQRANFESAKKVGGPLAPLVLFTPDGKFIQPTIDQRTAATRRLDRSGFGIQQEVPYDEEKEAIKVITQMNEGITEGISEMEGFVIPGHPTMNGRQVKALKEQIRKEMLIINKDHFMAKLNADENGNIDIETAMDLLAAEARKKGYTLNELQSVLIRDAAGRPVISPMFNTAADRFESLLMSMVNKIVDIKMPGKSFVQASSVGYRFVDSDKADLSNIIRVGDYDGSPLKAVRLEDGVIKPGQVILPFNFFTDGVKRNVEDFLVERDGKKILDPTRVPPELLQFIGARIPNQKHSSMHPIEVVGFVPTNMGDIVFIPSAMVKQMGGDFDVDKLYSYKRPYRYDKDTDSFIPITDTRERLGADDTEWQELKASTIESLQAAGMKPDAKGRYNTKLFNQFLAKTVDAKYPDGNVPKHYIAVKERNMSQLQRGYFDIHWAVLTHPDMLTAVMKPLDKDDLKQESRLLNKGGSTANFFDPMSQLDDFQRGKGAKRLVGATSWAVKFNARIQDKALQLGKAEVQEDAEGNKIMAKVPDFISIIDEHTGEVKRLTMLSGRGVSRYSVKDGDAAGAEDRTKGDNHVMVQSESVDNAKNRTLDNLNLTPDTYKAVQALIELQTEDNWAANSKYWTRLITQPIIWEYSSEMKQGNDSLSEQHNPMLHDSVMQKLTMKYTAMIDPGGLSDADTEAIDAIVFSPQLLLRMQTMEGKEALLHQLAALRFFGKLHGIGQRMFELESQFNQDVNGAGPVLFGAMQKQEQLANIDSLPLLNAGDLYQQGKTLTEVGATFDLTINTAVDVVSQIFPYHALQPILGKLKGFTNKNELTIDQMRDVLRAFRSYTYTTGNHWWTDAQGERVRLMYGPQSLAKRISEAKKTWGKDNPMLTRLHSNIATNAADADFIEYSAAVQVSTVDKQNMTNGWLYMLLNENEEQRRLGEDLLRYAYLTGGVQDANSFVQFVPVAYLSGTEFSSMLRGMEETLKESNEYENDGFLIQYLQHNPQLAVQVQPKQFGQLDSGREYPESFLVPGRETKEFSEFMNLVGPGGEMLPVVSYRSRADGKWILFMRNQVGETTFYTRVDTLGNQYSDEYNGMLNSGQRSIFPQNRSLAEKVPSLNPQDFSGIGNANILSFLDLSGNSYKELGIAAGGPDMVIESLYALINNSRLPEYQRLVAEFLQRTSPSFEEDQARSFFSTKPLEVEYSEALPYGMAGAADYGNTITLNSRMRLPPETASETFLHEMLHSRLMWMVAAAGFSDAKFAQVSALQYKLRKYSVEFRKKYPHIIQQLDNLERVRYEAFNAFRELHGEQRFTELYTDILNGKVTSDDHEIMYALSNLDEFVVGVPTNKGVAAFLNTVTSSRGETLLNKVWDIFARLLQALGEALGVKIKNDSLLREALVRIMKLTDLTNQRNLDITTMLVNPGHTATVPSQAEAQQLQSLLGDTYNVDSTISNETMNWSIVSHGKRTVVAGQRGRVIEKLYEQSHDIADALNRTHDLQARTALRSKYREVRDNIKQLHQSNDIATIAKVGESQLKWVDEVLRNPKPTPIDVNLALQVSTLWQSLVSILYGTMKDFDVNKEFLDVQNRAQKLRIELANTKAVQVITEQMSADVKLSPMDFREKLTDIDSISANVLALTRAKPLLVQATAALGWREANNKDEHVYRNNLRLKALEKKMQAAGLTPDMMLQVSDDGSSWGLVNRLSLEWSNKVVKDRSDLEAIIEAIDKSPNLDSTQREERKRDNWNKYWDGLKKVATFVDARIFFDVKTGARLKGPEADKAYAKLADEVGSTQYADELITKAQQKYQEYLSEREAMNDYLDTVIQLTAEEKADKTQAEQDGLLVKLKTDAMSKWLQYNSPIDLLNRLDKNKNVEFNSDGDRWIEMAPRKENKQYYDESFLKIEANPAMSEAYGEYKNILTEMISYLPIEIQRELPDNFFPIVPQDTASFLAKAYDKVRNWDAHLLQALTATDAEEAARLRPDKIPVMYTYPTSITKDVGNRSTDLTRVLEVFSMMALQHKYMGAVLDTINVAESVLNEVNRQRVAGEADGKPLRHVIDALKYFKDALVFRKPKELQGKVNSPIYSMNPAVQHRVQKEIRELMQEKEELQAKVNDKMIEGDYDTETEDKRIEAIDKKLTEYEQMARNIYGSKVVDQLISINQMKALGYNPFSAVSNYTFAEISLSVHAQGRTDYDPKTLREAMGVMTHSMKRYWSFGAADDRIASKVHGLMARVGIMGDVVDTDYGQGVPKRKSRTGRVLDPFNWQRSGDYFTKGKLMVAMMKKQMVDVVENGQKKQIPLWEAFNEDGEWDTEKYGASPDWDTRNGGLKFQQFRDRVRKMGLMVFGNQDKNAPLMAKKNWLWRLAGQFRLSWFPEGIATRFKAGYTDVNLGREVKGRWRSYADIGFLTSGLLIARQTLAALPGMKSNPFEGIRDRKGKLVSESPVDMENMRKNFAGLAWSATFTAAILIIRGLADDDEKKNGKRQLLVNMLIRNQQDLLLYSSPAVFNTISGNFLPASQVIVDYWKAMTATAHYLFGDTSEDRDAFNSWLKKVTRAGLPHPSATLYNKFETMITRDLDKIQR